MAKIRHSDLKIFTDMIVTASLRHDQQSWYTIKANLFRHILASSVCITNIAPVRKRTLDLLSEPQDRLHYCQCCRDVSAKDLQVGCAAHFRGRWHRSLDMESLSFRSISSLGNQRRQSSRVSGPSSQRGHSGPAEYTIGVLVTYR